MTDKAKKLLGTLLAGFGLPIVLFLLFFMSTFGSKNQVPDTVLTNASLPRVNLNQNLYHAETFGNKNTPVLIVLHDGPGGDYRSLLPLKELADKYFLVFYDQIGSGLSPRVPDEKLSIKHALTHLDAFVKHYGQDQPVSLLGHGWGGMLATAYAAQNPQRIGQLILAEPGFLNDEMASQILPAMNRSTVSFIWGATINWVRARHIKGPDEHARDDFVFGKIRPQKFFYCDQKPPEDIEERSWRTGFKAWKIITQSTFTDKRKISLNITDGLEQFKAPVLILASSCNTLTGREFQARQERLFQNASMSTIKESGHDLFWENPRDSIKAVREFLGHVDKDKS